MYILVLVAVSDSRPDDNRHVIMIRMWKATSVRYAGVDGDGGGGEATSTLRHIVNNRVQSKQPNCISVYHRHVPVDPHQ